MRQLKITKQVTNRETAIRQILQEIGKVDLITADEEVEFTIKKASNHSPRKINKKNLRFVGSKNNTKIV
jgi:hypothetical protein